MKKHRSFISLSLVCISSIGFAGGDALSPTPALKAKIMHEDFHRDIEQNPTYQSLEKSEQQARSRSAEGLVRKIQEEKKRFIAAERQKTLQKAEAPASGFDFKIPTAAEMSGALHWAHRQGIQGQGVDVLVLEKTSQTYHADIDRRVVERHKSSWGNLSPEKDLHATSVLSTLLQVAPQASPTLASIQAASDVSTFVTRKGAAFPIINRSIGVLGADGFEVNYSHCNYILTLTPDSLLVNSFGNSGKYEEALSNFDRLAADIQTNPITRRLIYAKSITPNRSAGFVNAKINKDANKLINHITLCAMGSKVLVATEGVMYAYTNGTSFSAPIISGAAALIKGKYPHFTAEQLQQVLLESADRTFLYRPNVKGYVNTLCLVFDPAEVADVKELQKNPSLNYLNISFDPDIYGKGVLNIRNALIYADLLDKNPGVEASILREVMLGLLEEEGYAAAKVLQEKWRAYHVRHKSKATPSSASPVDSAHGESMPGGSIPDTDALTSGPPTGEDA